MKIFPRVGSSRSRSTRPPPTKKAGHGATPSYADRAKKEDEASKKKNRRGPRSDQALRDRGCEMLYFNREGSNKLTFEQWKKVDDLVNDKWAEAIMEEPDDAKFPKGGYPRFVRSAFNNADCFLACLDKASHAWGAQAVQEALTSLGLGTACYADKAKPQQTVYYAVLPEHALKKGPQMAADILRRASRWPGEVKAISGLISPSDQGEKRRSVLLYMAVSKEADEAIVAGDFRGYYGTGEVRMKRKKKSGDGSVVFDPRDANPSGASNGQNGGAKN